jgi:hypothetical protein
MSRTATVPFTLSLVLACAPAGDGEPASTPLPAVRDSAGITVVENVGGGWDTASAWRLSAEPVLRLGGGIEGNPDHHFANVRAVLLGPAGTVLAADAGTFLLSVFDAEGDLVRRAGGEGSGPGELGRGLLSRVMRCTADSIFVSGSNRITVYSPAGVFARTFMLQPPAGQFAGPRTCHEDRIVATMRYGEWRTETGVFRDTVMFGTYSMTGEFLASMPPVPYQDRSYMRGPEGTGYFPLPFGRTLSVTTSGGQLVTSMGDDFEIRYFDTAGAIERIVRAPVPARPLETSDIGRYRDFVLDGFMGNEDERKVINSLLDGDDLPDTWPVIAELIADHDGNVWARQYDQYDAIEFFNYSVGPGRSGMITKVLPDSVRVWTVIGPSGTVLGEVATPPGFVVHDIGDDRIAGIWRDELDVDHVVVYSIVKANPAGMRFTPR